MPLGDQTQSGLPGGGAPSWALEGSETLTGEGGRVYGVAVSTDNPEFAACLPHYMLCGTRQVT